MVIYEDYKPGFAPELSSIAMFGKDFHFIWNRYQRDLSVNILELIKRK